MNTELRAVKSFGAAECMQRWVNQFLFEVSETQPVLQLRVVWPVRDSLGPEIHRFGRASGPQITKHQATSSDQIIWRSLLRLFECGCRSNKIICVERGLTLLQ